MKTTIILPAFTDSEWDTVDFFVTEVDVNELQKADDKIHFLKKDFPDFSSARFYADGQFFVSDEDGNTPLTKGNFDGVFDEGLYTNPEQRINSIQMKVYGDGSVMFYGYGKHTNEEFWTDSISIEAIRQKSQTT